MTYFTLKLDLCTPETRQKTDVWTCENPRLRNLGKEKSLSKEMCLSPTPPESASTSQNLQHVSPPDYRKIPKILEQPLSNLYVTVDLTL